MADASRATAYHASSTQPQRDAASRWSGAGAAACVHARNGNIHTRNKLSAGARFVAPDAHPATSRPTGVVGSALVPSPSLPVASPAAFACARIALFTAAAREPIKECRQCASTQPALSLRHCGCSAQNRARPRAPMAKQLNTRTRGPGLMASTVLSARRTLVHCQFGVVFLLKHLRLVLCARTP